MSQRPGFQYPQGISDRPTDLAFHVYGNNILWLLGQVDDLAASVAALQAAINGIQIPTATPAAATPNIKSGLWTPAITINTNLDAVTPVSSQYIRVSNAVVASGIAVVDPTAVGGCNYGMTLPIPTNFGALGELSGTCAKEGGPDAGTVLADVFTGEAVCEWNATITTPYVLSYVFLYRPA